MDMKLGRIVKKTDDSGFVKIHSFFLLVNNGTDGMMLVFHGPTVTY